MLPGFYAAYYVAVAVSMAFFPPYLRELGLSGGQVAALLSIAPLMHMGAPLLWGWIADRTRRPDLVLRLCCLGSLVFMVPLLFVRTMPAMLLVYVLHQAFNTAVIPLVDSLTLERVRTHGGEYGRIRIWGSVSFAATAAIVGPTLSARGQGSLAVVPALLCAAFAATWLVSLPLRGQGAERERPRASDLGVLLRDRRFLLLLVLAPLHWAANAPYNGFFSILLHDRGLSMAVVGQAFTASVVGELLVLYFFRRLRGQSPLHLLLAIAFAGSSLRWLLVAWVEAAVLLVAVQLLHALTFGLFWATAVAWLAECVNPRLRATGQTVFTAVTFGVGSMAGLRGSGFLYDATGGAGASFIAAGVVDAVAFVLALVLGARLRPRT